MFPIGISLDYKSCICFRNHQNHLLPAFRGTNIKPKTRTKNHTGTKKLVSNTKIFTYLVRKRFFIRVLPQWNSPQSCFCHKHFSVKHLNRIIEFFIHETLHKKWNNRKIGKNAGVKASLRVSAPVKIFLGNCCE